jgi:hypothetical protein
LGSPHQRPNSIHSRTKNVGWVDEGNPKKSTKNVGWVDEGNPKKSTIDVYKYIAIARLI